MGGLPRVTSGCGCCTLETCSNVQGYLMLVSNLCYFVTLLVSAVGLGTLVCPGKNSTEEMLCSMEQFFLIGLIAAIIFFGVSILATIAFLRGIFKRKPNFLMHYIRILVIHIVGLLVFIIWAFCNPAERWIYIILQGTQTGVLVYMLLCADSLRQKMKAEALHEMVTAGRPPFAASSLQFSPPSLGTH